MSFRFFVAWSFSLIALANGIALSADDGERANWTSFRNGGASLASGKMPVTWSTESGILWQKETDGYGQSSPVVFDSRIYLTSVIGPMKDECAVTSYDLLTGEELWSYKLDASAKAASNYSASRAAPTPVVDENAVYAFFESGDLLAIDHAGQLLWSRSLSKDYGKFENNHGLGSSPTQTKDLVILNVEHKGPSYLIAVRKSTGETAWKSERPSGSSWTSPIIVSCDGLEHVVVSSGGAVTGYDPTDGHEIWTVGGLAGNSVPSPTAIGPYLFVGARIPEFGSTQEAAQSNLCLRLDVEQGKHEVVWRASKAVCDYASPVVDGDCAYYLNNVGVLHCINSITGETHYTERLGATCWATPIVSGDNLFFFGKDGTTQVIQSGSKFTKVSTNLLWDPRHPPIPEQYQEHRGGEGHDEVGGSEQQTTRSQSGPVAEQNSAADKAETTAANVSARRSGRGGGMVATLLKSDANGDGRIDASELPSEFREMLPRVDLNKDDTIDSDELKAMEESFRKRREGSRESARDPIVYGVAAADGVFVIRTGTRIYCVRGTP